MHWTAQCVADSPGRRFFGIRTGRMNGTALDKHAHNNDEGDANQHHHVPVLRHPLSDSRQRLRIEQQILQTHQRTLRIDSPTSQEHIAVSLEIITRRTRSQTDALLGQSNLQAEFARTTTRGRLVILAGEFAQLPLINIRNDARRKEALRLVPQQANRSGAFALNAQLCAIIAFSLIVSWFGLRTLGRSSIARWAPRAFSLLATLGMRSGRHKWTRFAHTARTLTGTALCASPTRASLGWSVIYHIRVVHHPRIAALILAFKIVVPTIALLALFDYLVTAEGALGRLEAIAFLAILDGVQHIRNIANRARWEFTVVWPIAARGTGKHYVVAADAARPTILWVIVLYQKIRCLLNVF